MAKSLKSANHCPDCHCAPRLPHENVTIYQSEAGDLLSAKFSGELDFHDDLTDFLEERDIEKQHLLIFKWLQDIFRRKKIGYNLFSKLSR